MKFRHHRIALFILAAAFAFPAPTPGQFGGTDQLIYQVIGPWEGITGSTSFGENLANLGDVNGDGMDDFAVGDPSHSNSLVKIGAVLVYSGATGTLIHTIESSQLGTSSFGFRISAAGDLNFDGISDLLVSTDSLEEVTAYSGATFTALFSIATPKYHRLTGGGDCNGDGVPDIITSHENADSVWIYSGADQSLLGILSGGRARLYGVDIATGSDINHDGCDDIAVFLANKKVNVHSGKDGSILLRLKFENYASGNPSTYIYDVLDFCGDVNADGVDDIIVGAYPMGWGKGCAVVFSGLTGETLYHKKWVGGSDNYGPGVCGAGDVDGDGHADFLVGHREYNTRSGGIHLYSGATGNELHKFELGQEGFGYAQVGNINLDGDGVPDLIAGANKFDDNMNTVVVARVAAYRYWPYMRCDTSSISNSAGAQINIDLNFGDKAYPRTYRVLISTSGIGPTWTPSWVWIPLTDDDMVDRCFAGDYPFPNSDEMYGQLPPDGKASFQIVIPPNQFSSFVGRRVALAAIAVDSAHNVDASSIPFVMNVNP